jgi:4-aminobutyrate aminotransferase
VVNLVANAAARGAELKAGLEAIAAKDPRIGDVRGPGLMIATEFVKDKITREPAPIGDPLIEKLADAGLLLLTCGAHHNIIRWIPPLDVTSDEIQEALGIFERVLAEFEG